MTPPDLDERLAAIVATHATPGLAFGVVRDGDLAAFRGLGHADIDQRRPVTEDTVFRIASITKTMTAIAVLQLRDQGRIDLDDPLNGHLQATRIVAAPGGPDVTIRQALIHVTGVGAVRRLRDLRPPVSDGGVTYGRPVPSLVEHYAGGLRAVVPAGQRWSYSNHAYALLGQLIEDVTAQNYEDYLRENLFEPLGMASTDVLRSPHVADWLATGYVVNKHGRPKRAGDFDVIIRAAGSVYSTPADMARYAAAILGGGENASGQVLKPETLAEMLRPHWRLDERLAAKQGLGFILDDFAGHRIAWHDGGWVGFQSSMLIAPDDGVAVLAFENGTTPAARAANVAVLRSLLGLPATLAEELEQLRQPERPAVNRQLTGSYRPPRGFLTNVGFHQLWGGEIEVMSHDDGLAVRGLVGGLRQPTRLYPVDPSDPYRFRGVAHLHKTTAPVEVVFEVDAAGRATGLALFPTRLRRVAAWRSFRRIVTDALAATGAAAVALALRRMRR